MYLAKLTNGPITTYQLRRSFRKTTEGSAFGFRTVFDLGQDPRQYIKIQNEYIVLFDDKLVAAVSAAGVKDGEYLLEQLLRRFLPREARRRMELFESRSAHRPTPLTAEERVAIDRQVHIFDRRRLYYLRYGAVDQSRLARMHEKCCRPLLEKSRDEREYLFTDEEAILSPGAYLQYVYAIFNVQKHFRQSFAPWFPEALDRDEVADHFLSEICALNGDSRFWQGDLPGDTLHSHLRRYLIMFFDYTPAIRSFEAEFVKAFVSGHRRFRWPKRIPPQSPEKVTRIFATPYEELKKMTGEQLTRLYRKKAMSLHPDRGGNHDEFIELTEVYDYLQRMKK